MIVETLPPSADVAAIKAITDRDGAAIVPQLLTAAEVDELNSELDPWLTGPTDKPFLDDEANRFYRRVTGLPARSNAAVRTILHDRILGWAEALLGETGTIQLNTASVLEIHPGGPAQILHSDEGNWPEIVTGPASPEIICSCLLALTDFSEENGATRVLPGSHRDATDWLNLAVRPETCAAEMKAGSGLFFTGKVAHGGGANRSRQPRRGLTITFCVGWLRPEEALCLAVRKERALQLPERLQNLIGYGSYYRTVKGKRLPLLWMYDMDDASAALSD